MQNCKLPPRGRQRIFTFSFPFHLGSQSPMTHYTCPPFMSSSMQEGMISCLAQGSSRAEASFRVYHSLGAGTVPFVWETKPGTPKRTIDHVAATNDALPPISPPPLYQSKAMNKCTRKSSSCWPPRMTSWLNIRSRRRRPIATPGLHQTAASMIDQWFTIHLVVINSNLPNNKPPHTGSEC